MVTRGEWLRVRREAATCRPIASVPKGGETGTSDGYRWPDDYHLSERDPRVDVLVCSLVRQFFGVGRRQAGARLCLVSLLLPWFADHAWAQDRIGFDFDDPPETVHPITKALSYGANLELDFVYQDGFDLGLGESADETAAEPKAELAFTYEPNAALRAFLVLELSQTYILDSGDGSSAEDVQFEVKEAYFALRELAEGFTLQVGRQQYQDELDWYYDQELDAVRAYQRFGGSVLEASASREALVQRDMLNNDEVEKVNNFFLVGHTALGEDSLADALALLRDGREAGTEDLYVLGLQSTGELSSDLDYWVNAAYVGGQNTDADGGSDISGFGFDVMGTYVADLPFEPSLSLGLAYGSGDGDPGKGEDHNFRQTGLQSNEAELNGVVPIKYYGELFDPELSNLMVLTLGVGVLPSEATSVDLLYHYYRQDSAADALRSGNLDADPDGEHKELGHELDLVIGTQEVPGLTAELVLGAFFPGRAFGPNADIAYLAGLEVQFAF